MYLRRIGILLFGSGMFYICLLGLVIDTIVQVLCFLIYRLSTWAISVIKSLILKFPAAIGELSSCLFNSPSICFVCFRALFRCIYFL